MFLQEWNIQSRSSRCTASNQPFEPGERIYSALYLKRGQYERVDLSKAAWESRNENIAPLSAWQSEYTPPPPAPPEALKKDTAEGLLRSLIEENLPTTRNARYILALMLERKKVLRQVDRQKQENTTILVYEHTQSGDVWLIEDPDLKLTDLIAVQTEVSKQLAGPST